MSNNLKRTYRQLNKYKSILEQINNNINIIKFTYIKVVHINLLF